MSIFVGSLKSALVPPLGAVCIIVFALPQSPFAQPVSRSCVFLQLRALFFLARSLLTKTQTTIAVQRVCVEFLCSRARALRLISVSSRRNARLGRAPARNDAVARLDGRAARVPSARRLGFAPRDDESVSAATNTVVVLQMFRLFRRTHLLNNELQTRKVDAARCALYSQHCLDNIHWNDNE